jgi:hypothetical protein
MAMTQPWLHQQRPDTKEGFSSHQHRSNTNKASAMIESVKLLSYHGIGIRVKVFNGGAAIS